MLDALVVGAGPAGIGTGLALDAVDDLYFGIMERGRIGQTFPDWPEEQTFLTPSFTGNGFGATDLNAVHFETSPEFGLGVITIALPDQPLVYAAIILGMLVEFPHLTALTRLLRRHEPPHVLAA